MNLRVLTVLASIVALSLTASSLWIIHLFWDDPLLVQLAGVAWVNVLLGSVFWLSYSAYAIYCLVPKADAIVDPELSEQLQLRGDFMFYRLHRLIFYAFSSASRWCNGRLHPEFDFRRLPDNLRIPLALQFHGAWFFLLLGFIGAGALRLAEMWGLVVIN